MTDQHVVELIHVLAGYEQETEYLRRVAEHKVRLLRAELPRRFGSTEDDLS